ncbi:dual specificity protein phosphatase 22-B [Arctopsyche grandis]|uniref:dual specificity protein phosphatase 22-B n=1 Tax=Arctopsyche grandis TaxID=121162 RepID=UPI00406D6EA2
MGNGMNKVLPGLYVGNYRDSKDPAQLDRHRITHILAIHDAARRLHPDKHYLCVMASDSPDQNVAQYFSLCNDFIHAARLRDGCVLIHCLAGMSRSVTVAVAYIMSVTSLNWKEALKVVRAGRAVANPNLGFQRQLQDFETYKLLEERRRLKERYPSLALAGSDERECQTSLTSYQAMLTSRDICEGRCTMGQTCPTGVCRNNSSKRLIRRASTRTTPPASPRVGRTGSTPGRSSGMVGGMTRSDSTVSSMSSYRPRSSPAGLYSYTGGSAPPSRSCSRADVRLAAEVVGATVVVGGNNWARHRAASAPSTPLPTPPVSPHHWPRRTSVQRRA